VYLSSLVPIQSTLGCSLIAYLIAIP